MAHSATMTAPPPRVSAPLSPMTVADLRAYDEATQHALDRYPPLPAEANELVRRVRTMQIGTYRDLLLTSWANEKGSGPQNSALGSRRSADNGSGEATLSPTGVPGVLLSDVRREQVDWLWAGRIPFGKVTLLEGDPDEGKSTLVLDLAARASTGTRMPFDCTDRVPAGVVILNAEDGLGDTIRPRLEAAGANLTRILGFRFEELPEIPGSLDVIEAAVRRVEAVLVVVDPLMAFLSERVESHRDHHIRRALAPLAALAQRTGAAVVAVRHLNKSAGTSAKYRGGGSIGITGAARSVILAAPDPDDPERKIIARVKGNLGPAWAAIAYRLMSAGETVRIEWLEETAHTADGLLTSESTETRSALDEAVRLLTAQLADGPVEARQVKRELGRAGVSLRTLERARAALGVIARPDGYQGRWQWCLRESANTAQTSPNGRRGAL